MIATDFFDKSSTMLSTEQISQNVSIEYQTQEAGHIRLPNTEDEPSVIYIGVHNQNAIQW